MTQEKARAMVGATAEIPVGTMHVLVKIVSYERQYGAHRWLVQPGSGRGSTWVGKLKVIKA